MAIGSCKSFAPGWELAAPEMPAVCEPIGELSTPWVATTTTYPNPGTPLTTPTPKPPVRRPTLTIAGVLTS